MIKIYNINQSGEEPLKYEMFLFPNNEIGVKLDVNNFRFYHNSNPLNLSLLAKIHNSNDIMELCLVKNAIDNFFIDRLGKINLTIACCPYAQQDRICNKGEAFSLKVFASIINSLNFNKVTLIDPHSEVSFGVFNNVKVISQLEVIQQYHLFGSKVLRGGLFLSPDVGANKKTAEIAKFFEHKEFIRADKLRDLSTGKIIETIIYADNLNGQNIFICDDLCINGGTFIALAKELRKKNCGEIILYVTHPKFPNGADTINNLLKYIDQIYTTNSFDHGLTGYLPEAPKLNILNIDHFRNL